MGEGLLAKYMGKKRIIAETGAGQHGVALATAAAFFGLECEIHMGDVYKIQARTFTTASTATEPASFPARRPSSISRCV